MRRLAFSRLQKRGDHFYFRAAVPSQWSFAIKRREIKFSLATTDRATAFVRCRALSNAFDLLFRGNVLGKIPLDRLEEAAKSYFAQQLNKALELTLDIPVDLELDPDFEIACSQERVAVLTDMMKTLRFDRSVKFAAAEILSLANCDPADDDDMAYARKLAARVEIQTNTYLMQELAGGVYDGSASDPLFRRMAPASLPAPYETSLSKSATVGSMIETYISLKREGWVRKTVADQERSLGLARDVIGAQHLMSEVSAEDMRKIRDTLLRVPKNALKSKIHEGKTLLELASVMHTEELLSFKTREKYFMMIRGFFKWAVDEEHLKNFPGLKIAMPKGPKSEAIAERYPYSVEQLEAIFRSPLYQGYASHARRTVPGDLLEKDGYYWVPLIALYSGMRLGEIVQLRTGDLKSANGIHYFDITAGEEDDDRSLKTEGSKRWVPVHPVLLSLGLLDHKSKLHTAEKRLFEDIKPDANGYYSTNFSKWWSRRTQALKVHTKKTVFHSFRHNFIDALREGEVREDVSRALVGHSDGGDRRDSHFRYGSKTGLQRLREGIEKVSYPEIDFILQSNT